MNKKMTIGLAVNPATGDSSNPIEREYASNRTIQGITTSIEDAGSMIVQIIADDDILNKLSCLKSELDLVINIAEGTARMESRKTAVAGMLDHLDIPYTGSGVNALRIGNDKSLARGALEKDLHHPAWKLFSRHDEHHNGTLYFPLFVKPNFEGSSVGVYQDSVVYSERELRMALRKVLSETGRPAIVESFLDGNEYNVGRIGDVVFPPLEWKLDTLPCSPKVRDEGIKDIDIDYCNPSGNHAANERLVRYAIIAHNAIGARDYSRSDFKARRDNPEDPLFLEINLWPGLDPVKSDLIKAAALAGADYGDVVRSVVYSALVRFMDSDKYADRLAKYDQEAFRHSYENLVGLAKDSEPLTVSGKRYHVLTAKKGAV